MPADPAARRVAGGPKGRGWPSSSVDGRRDPAPRRSGVSRPASMREMPRQSAPPHGPAVAQPGIWPSRRVRTERKALAAGRAGVASAHRPLFVREHRVERTERQMMQVGGSPRVRQVDLVRQEHAVRPCRISACRRDRRRRSSRGWSKPQDDAAPSPDMMRRAIPEVERVEPDRVVRCASDPAASQRGGDGPGNERRQPVRRGLDVARSSRPGAEGADLRKRPSLDVQL